MKSATVQNHLTRLSNKLTSIYLNATYSRPRHRAIADQVAQDVWQSPAFNRLPGWAKSVLYDRRRQLSEDIYRHLVWAFLGSDGKPRQLDNLGEADRQKVFSGEITGRHYWVKTARNVETKQDGTIVETITKTITTDYY